ncbi:hypothetical protein Misp01_83770 [Microtetraspora sp. NBRC 13810]|nr:hypothetical protein Misp01_83770 [Microtetraspora sp. NBRC 13810]
MEAAIAGGEMVVTDKMTAMITAARLALRIANSTLGSMKWVRAYKDANASDAKCPTCDSQSDKNHLV